MTTSELLERMLAGDWPEDQVLQEHDEAVQQRAMAWLKPRPESDLLLLTVKLNQSNGGVICNNWIDGTPAEQVLKSLPELIAPVTEIDAASLRQQLGNLTEFSPGIAYPALLLNELRMAFPEPVGVRLVWLRPLKYQLQTHGNGWCLWASHFQLKVTQ